MEEKDQSLEEMEVIQELIEEENEDEIKCNV